MDTIANALTKIRNALMRKIKAVEVKKSGIVENILAIMKREGYIVDFKQSQKNPYHFEVELKYTKDGKSVIDGLERVSKGSKRAYVGKDSVPRVFNNYGIAIITTSKGVLTDKEARAIGVGGEIVCNIW